MKEFTGFRFGDWYSDEYNIIRVSGGDRYNSTLHAEIKDKIVEVPGVNGSYYFGSDYGPMQFDIDIAFDHLTEQGLRDLKRAFGTKEVQRLIFDEAPYKYYMAKLASPIELSYVCFDERKIVGTELGKGIQRDRGLDHDEPEDAQFSTEIVIPAGETIEYTLEHIPKNPNEITIITDEQEQEEWYYITQTDTDTYIITFSNTRNEDRIVTVNFTYETNKFVPGWKTVERYVYSDNTERIYKGEGTISLIAYFPFAKSVSKQLPNNGDIYYQKSSYSELYERVEEWADASGILSAADRVDIDIYKQLEGSSKYGFKLYNPGDLAVGFRLYCPDIQQPLTIKYYKNSNQDENYYDAILNIDTITLQENEKGIIIDTNVGLIYGVSEGPQLVDNIIDIKTSSNIYNKQVVSGTFFKIEPCNDMNIYSKIIITTTNDQSIVINDANTDNIQIFYDYLYF